VYTGVLNEYLASFVQTTLPKAKAGKKSKFVLGVSDHKIGNAIQVTALRRQQRRTHCCVFFGVTG